MNFSNTFATPFVQHSNGYDNIPAVGSVNTFYKSEKVNKNPTYVSTKTTVDVDMSLFVRVTALLSFMWMSSFQLLTTLFPSKFANNSKQSYEQEIRSVESSYLSAKASLYYLRSLSIMPFVDKVVAKYSTNKTEQPSFYAQHSSLDMDDVAAASAIEANTTTAPLDNKYYFKSPAGIIKSRMFSSINNTFVQYYRHYDELRKEGWRSVFSFNYKGDINYFQGNTEEYRSLLSSPGNERPVYKTTLPLSSLFLPVYLVSYGLSGIVNFFTKSVKAIFNICYSVIYYASVIIAVAISTVVYAVATFLNCVSSIIMFVVNSWDMALQRVRGQNQSDVVYGY